MRRKQKSDEAANFTPNRTRGVELVFPPERLTSRVYKTLSDGLRTHTPLLNLYAYATVHVCVCVWVGVP